MEPDCSDNIVPDYVTQQNLIVLEEGSLESVSNLQKGHDVCASQH